MLYSGCTSSNLPLLEINILFKTVVSIKLHPCTLYTSNLGTQTTNVKNDPTEHPGSVGPGSSY